jgi:hypothetical protein
VAQTVPTHKVERNLQCGTSAGLGLNDLEA